MSEFIARGIGMGANGYGGKPSPTRKRPDLCAEHGHPGCTYNPWLGYTSCPCGEVKYEGNQATHADCCGGPLEETYDRETGTYRRAEEGEAQ